MTTSTHPLKTVDERIEDFKKTLHKHDVQIFDKMCRDLTSNLSTNEEFVGLRKLMRGFIGLYRYGLRGTLYGLESQKKIEPLTDFNDALSILKDISKDIENINKELLEAIEETKKGLDS